MQMTTRTVPRRRLCLIAIAGLLLPSVIAGDTLRLTDGTVLHGQVRGYAADSLSFRTSFGSDIRVARDRIVSIEFTDSTGAPQGPGLGVPVVGVAADAGGGWSWEHSRHVQGEDDFEQDHRDQGKR